MLKKIVLLSLAVITIPAAQMPPQRTSLASLEGLPAELKQLILLHTGINGGVLNIPALAQGITTLAATSKSLHAAVNNPSNMLTLLKSLPKAGAKLLVELLQKKEKTLPVMKSKEVDAWLKSFTLEDGKNLVEAVLTPYPDLPAIKKMLANSNIAINEKGAHGNTALMWASDYGHINIVRALLAAGADINAKDNNGNTALIRASRNGHTDTVKQLLAAGADVNAARNGYAALLWASRNGHSDVVRVLVAAGADIHQKTDAGETPLIAAHTYAIHSPERETKFKKIIQILEAAEKAQKEKAARK